MGVAIRAKFHTQPSEIGRASAAAEIGKYGVPVPVQYVKSPAISFVLFLSHRPA